MKMTTELKPRVRNITRANAAAMGRHSHRVGGSYEWSVDAARLAGIRSGESRRLNGQRKPGKARKPAKLSLAQQIGKITKGMT